METRKFFQNGTFSEFSSQMSQKYQKNLLEMELQKCQNARAELDQKVESLKSKKLRLEEDQKNLNSQLGKFKSHKI